MHMSCFFPSLQYIPRYLSLLIVHLSFVTEKSTTKGKQFIHRKKRMELDKSVRFTRNLSSEHNKSDVQRKETQ